MSPPTPKKKNKKKKTLGCQCSFEFFTFLRCLIIRFAATVTSKEEGLARIHIHRGAQQIDESERVRRALKETIAMLWS